jgi:hypothetical protein
MQARTAWSPANAEVSVGGRKQSTWAATGSLTGESVYMAARMNEMGKPLSHPANRSVNDVTRMPRERDAPIARETSASRCERSSCASASVSWLDCAERPSAGAPELRSRTLQESANATNITSDFCSPNKPPRRRYHSAARLPRRVSSRAPRGRFELAHLILYLPEWRLARYHTKRRMQGAKKHTAGT